MNIVQIEIRLLRRVSDSVAVCDNGFVRDIFQPVVRLRALIQKGDVLIVENFLLRLLRVYEATTSIQTSQNRPAHVLCKHHTNAPSKEVPHKIYLIGFLFGARHHQPQHRQNDDRLHDCQKKMKSF